MAEEEEVNTDPETSEDSGSDDPSTPQTEVNEYEKQRQSRIAQNKSRMEAFGLHKMANSLMDMSQKSGKRKSQPKSKRVAKTIKEDDEYEPNDDEEVQNDDSSDSNLDSSSEESEGKKKKKKANSKNSGSKKVLIPDNTLEFMGHCGERIRLTFPKAPDKEVEDLIGSYPKGFNGFNCDQGERALRCIADLKSKYWNLRRLHMYWYPEFREEGIEGLPFPEGFNGFTLEESKEISGLIITLEDAYSRLRNYFQPNVHEVNKRKLRSDKQRSLQKQLDKTELIDEDEAVMQAIALSLKDFGGASDLQNVGSSQGSKGQATSTNEKRKKRTVTSRVQMTEDDLVINFCQFDEVGKGSIMLRDVQQMAASHDFTWTEKELADMIRCFDSDRDGKLSLDDFRNIVQRCSMLQAPENS